jgi:hypothetical protein
MLAPGAVDCQSGALDSAQAGEAESQLAALSALDTAAATIFVMSPVEVLRLMRHARRMRL